MSIPQAVRLRDIAKRPGLSESTVSRAMNGGGRLSSATRQLVLKAARQSGYTPNGLARSLRMRDAKTIGILVTDISNCFFASVIKGSQTVCRRCGYAIPEDMGVVAFDAEDASTLIRPANTAMNQPAEKSADRQPAS